MSKQYEKYKEAKFKWFSNIPENWLEARVSYFFEISRGRVIAETELVDDGLYPVYSSQTKNNGCLGYINTYDFDDKIITWTTDGANAGSVFLREGKFNCTNVCGALKAKKYVSLEYYLYFLQYATQFYKRPDTNGAKIMSNEMAAISLLIPTLAEQTQISLYLDYQTNIINQLISKKQKLIALLKEKRQAIINEAVTKGLNPNAKMKDSGIEWLGEVPKEWDIVRFRFLGSCQNGVSAGSEYFGSGDPFVSYSDVYKNEVLPGNVKGLALSTNADKINYSVREGDIFFTRTSETIDEIGIASTCFSTIPNAVFAGFLIRVRPNEKRLFKGFSKYYFRSQIPRIHFVKEMNLVTRASLSQELLKSLPVILPNIKDQKIIAEFLDKKTDNINLALNELLSQIEKLKEYRQSIISEAVTGKIDVRDWQAPSN